MPIASRKPCRSPGCPARTTDGWCDAHRPARYAQPRLSPSKRGYDRAWQKQRARILAAAPLCVDPFGYHAADGVVEPATDVDHVLPKGMGGADADSNLQPLCHSCHAMKTAHEQGRRVGDRAGVVIVCGPPGSGKSSYVVANMSVGDLVIDIDEIWRGLTLQPAYVKPVGVLPFVLACRDAVIARLSEPSSLYRAWLIGGYPRPAERAMLCSRLNVIEVVVMGVGRDECMRRIKNDKRRNESIQQWQILIDRWFEAYEPRQGERVIGGMGGQKSTAFDLSTVAGSEIFAAAGLRNFPNG